MTSGDTDGDVQPQEGFEGNSNKSRRSFLKAAVAFAAVLVVAGIAAVTRSLVAPPVSYSPTQGISTSPQSSGAASTSSSPFPRIKLANISDLSPGRSITFNYPLEETPNILVKLGVKAEGGVGPGGDIVAFSQICQHLGCIYGYLPAGASPSCDASYQASGPVGYCCCHGSQFDLAKGAQVIGGPSPRPQPQVILEFVSLTGDIYATGMMPPTIFGHNTGSNDVLYDLQGGTPVSQSDG
jgi:arsenite oxidase small subunit